MPPLIGFACMVGGVSGPDPGPSDGKAPTSPDWLSGAAPVDTGGETGLATNKAGVIAAAGKVALSGFGKVAGPGGGLMAASDIGAAGVGGGSVTARRRTALSPVKGRAVGAPGTAGPVTAGPKALACNMPGDPVAPGSTGSASAPAPLGNWSGEMPGPDAPPSPGATGGADRIGSPGAGWARSGRLAPAGTGVGAGVADFSSDTGAVAAISPFSTALSIGPAPVGREEGRVDRRWAGSGSVAAPAILAGEAGDVAAVSAWASGVTSPGASAAAVTTTASRIV